MLTRAVREKYIPLKDGHKVFTGTVGEGNNKLLTIHGGPGLTHECFANFPENLNPSDVQVIFYDQLGSFYSDQPNDPSLWQKERFVDELHQVVEALELQNQFVFANSWGAMILIDYILKYKTPFKGIVLSGMPASFQKFRQNIRQLRAQLPQAILQKLEEYEKKGETGSPAYQQMVFEHWFSRHYCTLKPWPEPLMNTLQHLALPVMANLLGTDVFNLDGAASSWNRSNDLEKIKIPTLLVAGKVDLMLEEDLEYMGAKMPQAESFLCPSGGHFCWWEDEQEFFTRVNRFIRKHQ